MTAQGAGRRPDWRPLDQFSSIKTKLGVLVAASIAASVALTWLSVGHLGWRARYGVTLAILGGLAVTQLLAHGMTSPLRQMTAAARAMAAGRPPGPIRATSRDEVGELARAFIAMSQDLLTADAQRRDLLANVAHELRTPVAARRVSVGGAEVHLTRIEFDLLTVLARRCGRVVERDRLLADVWEWDPVAAVRAAQGGAARAVDSHVKALRRKLGADRIRTVHGVGYALEARP